MRKSFFNLGILIVIISLLLAVTGPVGAGISCKLEIHKQDPNGEALAGATFVISPDPTSGPSYSGELTVVDNGPIDEDSIDGVLLITGFDCHPSQVFTITETIAPPGYIPAPPQTAVIDEYDVDPLVLTFINEPIVGSSAQTVNTVGIVLPWIGLAFVIIGGITWFVRKRRSA